MLEKAGDVPVELGPEDLRDLPRHFGQADCATRGLWGLSTSRSWPRSIMRLDSTATSCIAQAEQFIARRGRRDRPGLRPRRRPGPASAMPSGPCATGASASRSTASTRSRSAEAVAAGAELVLSVNADQSRPGRRLGRRGRRDPRRPGLARRPRRDDRASSIAAGSRSGSIRSSSRSASASRRRSAAISRSAAAIPRPR